MIVSVYPGWCNFLCTSNLCCACKLPFVICWPRLEFCSVLWCCWFPDSLDLSTDGLFAHMYLLWQHLQGQPELCTLRVSLYHNQMGNTCYQWWPYMVRAVSTNMNNCWGSILYSCTWKTCTEMRFIAYLHTCWTNFMTWENDPCLTYNWQYVCTTDFELSDTLQTDQFRVGWVQQAGSCVLEVSQVSAWSACLHCTWQDHRVTTSHQSTLVQQHLLVLAGTIAELHTCEQCTQ